MELPEYLGRYRLVKLIGKGGMAKIFHATDDLIGRDVAVKVTNTSEMSGGKADTQAVMNQFSMEMQISGQLSHHNFVTIYDAGMQGVMCYLVMELLDGITLDKYIQSKTDATLDMRQKLDILVQVARALHFAHQRGITHRDIKPSNIMRLPNGQAKVMDFGVASVSPGSTIRITEGTRLQGSGGTPYYMSPEQINKRPIDGRSDLFSLAVTAYELLTAKRPFKAESVQALYDKILNSEPVPIQEHEPSIPEKVASLIRKSLSKDPALRQSSCLSFAEQLDEIINRSFFEADGSLITQETLSTLRKYRESFPLFYDMDNAQLYKLLQVCQVRKHNVGDTIFHEGEVAREMFLVMSGQIRIVRIMLNAGPLTLHMLRRGDIFGEMGIIDGGPRSATAVAETECQTLVLHQVSLLKCDDNTAAKLHRNLASILSSKLRLTSAKLDDFARHAGI